MKSSNENDTGLAFANESVNNIAGAVIAAHANLSPDSLERKDLEDVVGVLTDAMNVLDNNKSLQDITTKEIESLEKKAESIKSRSTIGAKIKAWFNSFIKFLKSPFIKQQKEELQQATENTVKEIEVVQKQAMQERAVEKQITTTSPVKESPVQPSLVEARKPQATIPTTAPLAVQETTRSIQDVTAVQAVVSSAPVMPPPPVQVTVHSVQGVPPPPPPPPPPAYVAPPDLLAALRGKEKKSAEQIEKLAKPAGDNLMNELAKKLAIRREKAGEAQGNTKLPEVFLKDKAEFEKQRVEEAARQAKQDAIDAPRIAAALAAEKQAASAKPAPPKVAALNEVGVPIPPPPPPPPPPPIPGTPGTQPPKPLVNKPPTAEAKVQAKPIQLAVDKEAIMEAVKGLKKLSQNSTPKKPTETSVPNFRANLNPPKGHGGRE